MNKGKVVSQKATPRGAYPHIKRVGDFIFISGTSSRRSDNSIAGVETVDNMNTKIYSIEEQTKAVIENIKDILEVENAELNDIVDVTSFLVNMNDFAGYNKIYSTYFNSKNGPTRTTVAVHQLPHPDLLIEIKATAFKPL